MNSTMEAFGYPRTLLCEYEHWVVLLRPKQATLGALVLASKSAARAFPDLPAAAFAELSRATREIEATLRAAFACDKLNYLMLMMVDPEVHFHVLPRYAGAREVVGVRFTDPGWPKMPDLAFANALTPEQLAALQRHLATRWIAC